VIVRMWQGVTSAAQADAYVCVLAATGVHE
jgi:hypothetical protein